MSWSWTSAAAVQAYNERQTSLQLTFSLQLQVQNSPLKTLLEIIVRHHIKDLKNDKITSSESDPLLSTPMVSAIAKSPAVTPTSMDDTKTEGSTPAIKLRCFTNAVILNTLFRADLTFWKLFFLTLWGLHRRSDIEEICLSQPVPTSLLPETDRMLSHSQTGFWAYDSEYQQGQPMDVPLHNNDSFIRKEPEKKISITESTQRSRTNRIRRGMMAGPIACTPQVLNFWCIS